MKKTLAAIVIGIIAIIGAYTAGRYNPVTAPIQSPATAPAAVDNAKIVEQGKRVLVALRDQDYKTLQKLSSTDGLTLRMYPYRTDLTKSDITNSSISKIPSDTSIHLFGYSDGKGDPINLTFAEFFKQQLYNHDYINAPITTVNKLAHEPGNTTNTILSDVAGYDVVGFGYDRINPEYGGFDWTVMYLVFEKKNGDYRLRAIVKDNWTI